MQKVAKTWQQSIQQKYLGSMKESMQRKQQGNKQEKCASNKNF